MSGATYRIDVEHQPDPNSSAGIDWIARVTRLSDEKQVTSLWGISSEHATAKARQWLAAQNAKRDGRTLYVDDYGDDETPHSVKA